MLLLLRNAVVTNQFFMCIKQCCALLIFLLLAGCAGTSVVSKSGSPVATHQLNSVHVTWIDNPVIPYKFSILIRSHRKLADIEKASLLADADKAEGHQAMGQLVSFFRSQITPKIRDQLIKNNVHDGKDTVLELLPVLFHYDANGDERFRIKASVKQECDPGSVWSVTIETRGPKDKNEILLDNFVGTLMDELKKAGWLRERS